MQVTKTTTHLQLPRVRLNLPLPVALAICTFCLIAIAALVGRIQSTPAAAPQVVPTASLPIVVIQKEREAAPPAIAPTPDMALRAELEQLRQRVQELEAQQAAAPQPAPQVVEQPAPVVIYQAVESAPEMAAPTPTEQVYQTDSAPNSLEARQALIGTDPNAPACMGANGVASPLCGGLTNAEAQAALDKERQQGGDYPAIHPGVPGSDTWKMEHCFGSGDAEVCHQ